METDYLNREYVTFAVSGNFSDFSVSTNNPQKLSLLIGTVLRKTNKPEKEIQQIRNQIVDFIQKNRNTKTMLQLGRNRHLVIEKCDLRRI